jgi:hypothetical protein
LSKLRIQSIFKASASTGVVPELIKQLTFHSLMLRVMYKNAQLSIILATMTRRRDLSDIERGVSKGVQGV